MMNMCSGNYHSVRTVDVLPGTWPGSINQRCVKSVMCYLNDYYTSAFHLIAVYTIYLLPFHPVQRNCKYFF